MTSSSPIPCRAVSASGAGRLPDTERSERYGRCDPTGDNPSAPYASATENADGTFTIVWDSTSLGTLGRTTSTTISRSPSRAGPGAPYQSDFLRPLPILAGTRSRIGRTDRRYVLPLAPLRHSRLFDCRADFDATRVSRRW